MASLTSGGVLANDDADEGEYEKSEKSGSKFRNSVQSVSKVGSPGCDRSSRGISNKVVKSLAGTAVSAEATCNLLLAQRVLVEQVYAHLGQRGRRMKGEMEG